MKNRIPELVAAKFGGKENVIVQHVVADMGGKLPYSTVERWIKDDVTRADFPILEKWCKYLGVGVGDILEYVPDEEGAQTA